MLGGSCKPNETVRKIESGELIAQKFVATPDDSMAETDLVTHAERGGLKNSATWGDASIPPATSKPHLDYLPH